MSEHNEEPRRAWPLSWPAQWPRTHVTERASARFTSSGRDAMGNRTSGRAKSMSDAAGALYMELDRLGACDVVVSTNVELRLDGQPYSNRVPPADPGAAVYFTLEKRPVVLACDQWVRVEDNVYAIALHIESMRGQARWGVGKLSQAFMGYRLLTGAVAPRHWKDVLGLGSSGSITAEQVKARYRSLAAELHPDAGGNNDGMAELNRARDEGLAAAGNS